MADSEAATVKMKKENNWPITSSLEHEKITKFKLTASNNNSIDINTINIFRLIKERPINPKENKQKTRERKNIILI
jgi:hypothetical protein